MREEIPHYGFNEGVQDNPDLIEQAFLDQLKVNAWAPKRSNVGVHEGVFKLLEQLQHNYGLLSIPEFVREYRQYATALRLAGYHITSYNGELLPIPFGYQVSGSGIHYIPQRRMYDHRGNERWETFIRQGRTITLSTWQEAWVFCFRYSERCLEALPLNQYRMVWWINPLMGRMHEEITLAPSLDDASIRFARYLLDERHIHPAQLLNLEIKAELCVPVY